VREIANFSLRLWQTTLPLGISSLIVFLIILVGDHRLGLNAWFDPRRKQDFATHLILDKFENVFITGRANNGGADDFATLKYNCWGVSGSGRPCLYGSAITMIFPAPWRRIRGATFT
jgi:hypothetical protein